MQLWTDAHIRTVLPALAVMLLLGWGLRMLLIRKSLPIRMIPLQVIACMLVALEVGKQVLSFARGYDLYHIPLHVCSLFVFVLPAMAFYRGGHRQRVNTVTCSLCTAVTAMMLIYPNLIYSAENIRGLLTDFMSFHTVVFHNLVMLAFVLILFLELHPHRAAEDGRTVAVFTAGYCAVAATAAQLLKTNYANFYSCNIPVFERLRCALTEQLGSAVTQLLYVLIVAALHILFIQGAFRLYRLLTAAAALERSHSRRLHIP